MLVYGRRRRRRSKDFSHRIFYFHMGKADKCVKMPVCWVYVNSIFSCMIFWIFLVELTSTTFFLYQYRWEQIKVMLKWDRKFTGFCFISSSLNVHKFEFLTTFFWDKCVYRYDRRTSRYQKTTHSYIILQENHTI